MGDRPAEIAHRVRVDLVNLARLIVVHNPVISPLLVVQSAVVRAVGDERELLTVVVRRAVAAEIELGVGVAVGEAALGEFIRLLSSPDVGVLEEDAPLDSLVDLVVVEVGAAALLADVVVEVLHIDWNGRGIVRQLTG